MICSTTAQQRSNKAVQRQNHTCGPCPVLIPGTNSSRLPLAERRDIMRPHIKLASPRSEAWQISRLNSYIRIFPPQKGEKMENPIDNQLLPDEIEVRTGENLVRKCENETRNDEKILTSSENTSFNSDSIERSSTRSRRRLLFFTHRPCCFWRARMRPLRAGS